MAQLIVRNLPDELVKALKVRAAENMRSAEEEHREILRSALQANKPPLKDLLEAIPAVGEDQDFERDQDVGRSVEF